MNEGWGLSRGCCEMLGVGCYKMASAGEKGYNNFITVHLYCQLEEV